MARPDLLPPFLIVLIVFWFRDELSVFSDELVGRLRINPQKLVQWQNSPNLNNENCIVDRLANGCEDVKIHFPSGTAFLACGNPVERTRWYPPSCRHDAAARSESSFREQLFKHDIETGKTVELQIKGLEGDFVTHGIDLFQSPDDPTLIYLFAVRHARDGDSISILSHRLGSYSVELIKNVKHSGIKTANGVAAVGEFQFYLTNDHYFAKGPLRYIEEKFGPWRWATHVQYCDASRQEVQCRQVTGNFPGANGLAVWKDRMFVGDSKNGTVTVYHIDSDFGVRFEKQIDLGAAADNINVIPATGDMIVSIFPGIEDLPTYLANVRSLGKEILVPAAALRLVKEKGYEPELIYHDGGSVVSFMTAMALDSYRGVVIGAGVLQYGGFAVCKVSPETIQLVKSTE